MKASEPRKVSGTCWTRKANVNVNVNVNVIVNALSLSEGRIERRAAGLCLCESLVHVCSSDELVTIFQSFHVIPRMSQMRPTRRRVARSRRVVNTIPSI